MADQPPALRKLLARLARLVAEATDALAADPARVAAWQDTMASLLRRYHAAAYLAGAGLPELPPSARAVVAQLIADQLAYLDAFAAEVAAADAWEPRWSARAAMYAQSPKVAYWSGATRGIPLPAMPAEGTQCLTNCGCSWEITRLAGDGNVDAYWRRGDDDSCQTCVERAAQWSPVQIRDGVLQ